MSYSKKLTQINFKMLSIISIYISFTWVMSASSNMSPNFVLIGGTVLKESVDNVVLSWSYTALTVQSVCQYHLVLYSTNSPDGLSLSLGPIQH